MTSRGMIAYDKNQLKVLDDRLYEEASAIQCGVYEVRPWWRFGAKGCCWLVEVFIADCEPVLTGRGYPKISRWQLCSAVSTRKEARGEVLALKARSLLLAYRNDGKYRIRKFWRYSK